MFTIGTRRDVTSESAKLFKRSIRDFEWSFDSEVNSQS
jgi:hypothetical protein